MKASKKSPPFNRATLELAGQIVFEHPQWTSEHIGDMMATFRECGDTPPCTADQLEDACSLIQKQKESGADLAAAIEHASK